MYLNHVQLIGFLGKDPEKRQVRGNGANFTVLSVATQQSDLHPIFRAQVYVKIADGGRREHGEEEV